jgi:hypothetical protein
MDSVVLYRPTTSNFGRLEAAMAEPPSNMHVKYDKVIKRAIFGWLLQESFFVMRCCLSYPYKSVAAHLPYGKWSLKCLYLNKASGYERG